MLSPTRRLHIQKTCEKNKKNTEAAEYRECIGVLRLSVQRVHQRQVSPDPSRRHGEHGGVAVQ